MKQMRGLYARANSVLRKFAACSFEVKLRLFQAFCTSFYCAHLWYKFTKHVMSKVRVAYNNVFRLLFGYRRRCSASEMFVYNNIYNFDGRTVLFVLVLSGRNGLRVFILFIISVVIVGLQYSVFE